MSQSSRPGKRHRGRVRSAGAPITPAAPPAGPAGRDARAAALARAAAQRSRGRLAPEPVPWWRRNGLPAGVALAAVAVVAAVLVLGPGSGLFGGASPSPSAGSSAAVSPGATRSGGTNCPTSEPPALASGQTRTVTIETPNGNIVIKVEGSLSPIAAGNFVALATCGFYDGIVFHRTPTMADGSPFVIQGGDPKGDGTGGPGYTIKDEPVTTTYKRGTVAMARSQAPDSQGSQFFIVLSDAAASPLSSANNYAIFGSVTTGMEVADAIYQASAGEELPSNPITMTKVTVSNP